MRVKTWRHVEAVFHTWIHGRPSLRKLQLLMFHNVIQNGVFIIHALICDESVLSMRKLKIRVDFVHKLGIECHITSSCLLASQPHYSGVALLVFCVFHKFSCRHRTLDIFQDIHMYTHICTLFLCNIKLISDLMIGCFIYSRGLLGSYVCPRSTICGHVLCE